MKKITIITTGDLPEAYFLAGYLINKKHDVQFVNLKRRNLESSIVVVKRLAKNRGIIYLIDYLLGRLVNPLFQKSTVVPFPEVDDQYIDCIQRGTNYIIVNDLNNEETVSRIRSFMPDVMLLSGAPIIKRQLYSIPKKLTVNRHLGLAPKYRGSDTPLWALSRKDYDNIGFTIHLVSDRVDGGDILSQGRYPIDKDETYSQFLAGLQRMASQAYLNVIEKIIADEDVLRQPQTETFAPFPPAGLTTKIQARFAYRRYDGPGGGRPVPHRSPPEADQDPASG